MSDDPYVPVPALLADLASELLDEATAALPDPPERVYVAHGEPAYDCAQLTVHVVRVQPRLATNTAGTERCTVQLLVRFAVTLLRCVTAVERDTTNPIPTMETLEAENLALAQDGWRVFKHLTRAWAEGVIPSTLSCGQVRWGALEPRGPMGTLAGWRLEVEYEL